MKPLEKAKKPGGIEDLFFSFQKKMFDAIRLEMKDLSCSVPQIDLLRYLEEHGEASLTEVAEYLQITKPSASVMIDGMEMRKLVLRTIPDYDRRSVILTLTPSSKKFISTITEKKKKVIGSLLQKIDKKEQAELSHLLSKLVQ
jgi:DNA-binding MarR family transcriptional regulator